jgi:branched-subunit amino acid aminotransferase/4-amino-4-deoxychorismate lyase
MISLVNRQINHDGEFGLPVCNRGLFLGDGIFTTILAKDGRLSYWGDHCERLKRDAAIFRMPFNEIGLYEAIHHLLEEADLLSNLARVRVTLTRAFADESNPTLGLANGETAYEIVTAAPYAVPSTAAHLMLSSFSRGVPSVLTAVKHLGYQVSQFALHEAQQHGCDDAVLLNHTGKIACATTSNIYFYIDDKWKTPAVTDGALPGVIRERLIRCGAVEEASLVVADIDNATHAFLTNSLMGIRPIIRLGDKSFSIKIPNLPSLD